MKDLENKILAIIQNEPGIKARLIASKLSVDKTEINSLLYGKLKGKVIQNKKYGWSLKSFDPDVNKKTKTEKKDKTILGKLSNYYLDCITNDSENGIRAFVQSKFDYDYAELEKLPLLDNVSLGNELNKNENAQKLVSKSKSFKSDKTAYLGYPVSIMEITSKKGQTYKFVEPVFTFPLDLTNKNSIEVNEDIPNLNPSFIRNVTDESQSSARFEETLLIYEELGLSDNEDLPDLEDVFIRLQKIRPNWKWQEKIDPYNLSKNKNLSEIQELGIYNKAVIIFGAKSMFTQGLEKELNKLSELNLEDYSKTSLGKFLSNDFDKIENNENNNLIEVLPLNNEQREAVQSSLNNSLTVITGPPGTGKSQVVTSILVNAAFNKKKVLFASKNNKAVDVVEYRVNGLGPNPVLLRQGRSHYQTNLSEYLTTLLSTKVNKAEQNNYKDYIEKHQRLLSQRIEYQKRLDEIINLRNQVDQFDQKLYPIREKSEELFKELSIPENQEKYKKMIGELSSVWRTLEKSKDLGGFGIMDWWTKEERDKDVKSTKNIIDDILKIKKFKTPAPKQDINLKNRSKWLDFIRELINELDSYTQINNYFASVKKLSKSEKPEDISKLSNKLLKKISDNSEDLWKSWLKLQPNRLTQDERKVLNDYSSLLNLITSSDDKGDKITKSVWAKYYRLFPHITNMLPCWAVTSLSATRIPFQSNFFDILVVDEASQCDIASLLPLMYRCKSVVVIGDPKQLRHISILRKQQDIQLMTKHDVFENFTGWNYSNVSFFDLAKGYCSPNDIINLKDHHRSHAQIINFSNKQFYGENLRIATRYENLRTLKDKKPAVRWIDLAGETKIPPSGGGAFNNLEIDKIIKYLNDLIFKKGYKGSIGIVSPFRAQINYIRQSITNDEKLLKELNSRDFICDTVHKFQGDERDLMIFSPVVSKGISRGSLHFLKNNGNLFNVAITRARGALITIGDMSACIKCGISYLSSFAKYTRELKYEDEINEEEIKKDYGPSYPSVTDPDKVSDWEKILYKELYKNKIKTIPQYNIDQYRLDLAFISKKGAKLDIEVDGEKYHKNWDGELCLRDQVRNLRLFELGWDVKRFWVYEIRDNLKECVNIIKKWAKEN